MTQKKFLRSSVLGWMMPVFVLALMLESPAWATGCQATDGEGIAGALPQQTFDLVDHIESRPVHCPLELRALKSVSLPEGVGSLCELYDRYHNVMNKLKAEGIATPSRIADVIAPRFINYPDWEAAKAKGNYSPYTVYEPAPQTWTDWEEAARLSEQRAALDFEERKVQPITLPWILQVHHAGLVNLGREGDFRQAEEIGKSFDRDNTLTMDQENALKNIEYKSINHPGQGLVTWVATQCRDELSEADQQALDSNYAFPPAIADQTATFEHNGVQAQCGFYEYAEQSEVQAQLKKWQTDVNSKVTSWGTAHPEGDPIQTAAHAQRWFIAIHPFEGGNGRTSRFIMDTILQSVGLPTPILTQMNDDDVTPEKDWAKVIGAGMLRTVQVMEACAADISKPGCQVVPSVADYQKSLTDCSCEKKQ